MADETLGTFREVSLEFCEVIEKMRVQRIDAEIRMRKDGTFDVFELERKKCKPQKRVQETE